MLIKEHSEISDHLKEAVKKEYEIAIMNRVMTEKKAVIARWKRRNDYQATLQVISNDPGVPPGLFKHPAQAMKEEEVVFQEPELADYMSEYDLRLKIYYATIRKLLKT